MTNIFQAELQPLTQDLQVDFASSIIYALSPTAIIEKSEDGNYVITVTDKNGTTIATIPVITAKKVDNVTTIYSGAEAVATILDGERGPQGIQGIQGKKGDTGNPGSDGYSPTATVTKSGKVATISITDKNGTTTAEVLDGEDGVGNVTDVQINGTSILDAQGVANVPTATAQIQGAVKVANSYGLEMITTGAAAIVGCIRIVPATSQYIKSGDVSNYGTYRPIVPRYQHESTFYGLAKAAGDTTQSKSSNPVGQYTDEAKAAIKSMLGVGGEMAVVTVSDTAPIINALSNTRYICGTVTSISITAPASGICDIVFTSGSTVAVLTTTGVTFPDWFDPDNLETDTVYEINICDGRAVVASWA